MQRLRKIKKTVLAVSLLFLAAALPVQAETAHREYSTEELLDITDGIMSWKGGGSLLQKEYLKDAGYTQGDWYALVEGRLGVKDDYAAYQAAAEACVEYRYESAEKLDPVKATEWHRIALAISALGGDPTNVGEAQIDLIEDGVYNREKTAPLDAQGVNGTIWGLIALDSFRYAVPQNAVLSREDIIQQLLEYQLPDGGFAFGAKTADPDITAMALYALTPYYNSEASYTYTKKTSGETVTQSVRQTVDEAIVCLSGMQKESGGFFSWESENAESISQVIIALSAYGIDVQRDERFLKNGNSMLDALMEFRMSDGGFIHSREYDEENASADPNESNSMAGEQVACALTAYCRMQKGMRNFYDFRPEQSGEVKQQITELEEELKNLSEAAGRYEEAQLIKLYESYQDIPKTERSYVYHYYLLSDAMKVADISCEADDDVEAMDQNAAGGGSVVDIRTGQEISTEITFTKEDAKEAEKLAGTVSTEYELPVACAIYRIRKSGKENEYAELLTELKQKEQAIRTRKREIEALNLEIKEKLYPFEEIGIGDFNMIRRIRKQYEAMTEYDRAQIEGYEDVEKSYVQSMNLLRAVIIAAVTAVIVIVLIIVVLYRSRKRRQEKRKRQLSEWEMEE